MCESPPDQGGYVQTFGLVPVGAHVEGEGQQVGDLDDDLCLDRYLSGVCE